MRRFGGAALVALAIAMTAAGCGDPAGGGGAGTGTDCTDTVRTAGEPGQAEPLLVFGSLGFAPTIVYTDGAVVVPDDALGDAAAAAAESAAAALVAAPPRMMPGYHGEQPGGFEAGWLSDCELDVVVERAEDLFTDDLDVGMPQVTDSGSTEFSYDGRTISAYAFSRGAPTEWNDLSREQQQARQSLADLWTTVEDGAEITGPVAVERVFVYSYGPVADDDVEDWPLSTAPSEIARCTTVTDATEVEALLSRLDDGPLLRSEDWRLAVLVAAPGVPDCEG